MPSISKFTELMDYYCRVASVGYDQYQRWDVWDGGETDCSALVITCLRQAGFDTGSASYTGNMSAELTARGWRRLGPDLSQARPGDILLNDANHVAAVIWGEGWGATIAQASVDENGNITGGAPGDQTGWETNERGMYDYPWDCILRWEGADSMGGWKKNDKGWWYEYDGGGWPAEKWEFIDGNWYYFNEEGYMKTGWLHWCDQWYYLNPVKGSDEGKMVVGWKKIKWQGKRSWFLFLESGVMANGGFYSVNGEWYAFEQSGRMVTADANIIVNKESGAVKIVAAK